MPENDSYSYSPETIYAFTTPPPLGGGSSRGGVSILRLSGAKAKSALEKLTSSAARAPARPRELVLREISFNGEMIDRGLVVFFESPHSWTGEDVVEFHLHASPAIERAISVACRALGLRAAEAGEFSKRAFINGKADLTELEGLVDLIESETEAQRKQALGQMEGGARKVYEDWRHRLLKVAAQVEARIDFSEDVEGESSDGWVEPMDKIREEIRGVLSLPYGERLRLGVRLSLLGGANAGKSTLFNLLAGREAAITSPRAGTTRDILELGLDIGGYPVVVNDGAGLRASSDEVESEGVRRAEASAVLADVRVILLAPDIPPEENSRALSFYKEGDIVMVNKKDKGDVVGDYEIKVSLTNLGREAAGGGGGRGARDGGRDGGFEKFNKRLIERLRALCEGGKGKGGGKGENPVITRARHRDALEDCEGALARAAAAAAGSAAGGALELCAEDLRVALSALGRITGAVGVEDMLDELFAEFCIGK